MKKVIDKFVHNCRKQRSNFSGFAFNVPPGGIDGVGIRSTTSIKKSILITVVSILCGFIGARNEMAEFQRYFCDRRLMQRTLPVEWSVELSMNLCEISQWPEKTPTMAFSLLKAPQLLPQFSDAHWL